MKRAATLFLQLVIVVLGGGLFAALLYEPWIEGVNASATSLRDIYFDDPFLAYIYIAFIPVFVGLYQVFRLVGNMRGGAMRQSPKRALRIIRNCALTFAGLIFAAVVYITIFIRGSDDIAGGVAMGLMLIIASSIVAAIAARSERTTLDRV